MNEKEYNNLTNIEKYNLHLKTWKEADIIPTKEEKDEIAFLYKIGKYAKKNKSSCHLDK